LKIKFRNTDGRKFKVGGVSGVAFMDGAGLAGGDAAYLEVNGRHGRIKTTLSDRIYYIISGSGEFVVGGKKYLVEADDAIAIPSNTEYDFEGNMRIVMFCSPPFDPTYEVSGE